ncbi:MAG: hypothetical protein AABX54_02670 [Nanoarchaeota archaeon]
MKKNVKNNLIIWMCFILVGIGMIGIILNRLFCRNLCLICKDSQLGSCFFLFLFAGIIFIVDGASLYLTNKTALFILIKSPGVKTRKQSALFARR